jgi:hypothetical protein
VTCIQAKEFLGANGITFQSWDIAEPDARRTWEEEGSPQLPSLLVDGRVIPLIVPPVQIAAALGLPAPSEFDLARLAWDIAALHDAWLQLISGLEWTSLQMRTPSRGRTPIDLVVNVFFSLQRTIEAWETGIFESGDEKDAEAPREDEEYALRKGLTDRASTVAYIADRAAFWNSFALELSDESVEGARLIDHVPRGQIRFQDLLWSQRQHAAVHFRQITFMLDEAGVPHSSADALIGLHGLTVPDYPY